MTATLVGTGPKAGWPGGRPAARRRVPAGHQSPWPGGSGFLTDTWVFFAGPDADGPESDHWGLGFGPADTEIPRWSLFHCVAEDRFDSHFVFPQINPSNGDLLRWSTSVVGSATATSLLQSVGSCLPFYRQYFAERPDLRGRVAR